MSGIMLLQTEIKDHFLQCYDDYYSLFRIFSKSSKPAFAFSDGTVISVSAKLQRYFDRICNTGCPRMIRGHV